jgi:alpha-beta hydrolase superfamily lysophospholipase/thiol-disulfide isomerase/thioredoxin
MKLSTTILCTLFALGMTWQPIAVMSKASKPEPAAGIDTMADAHPAPCLSWIDPHKTPKAALLCIHGLGLSSDAYTNLGRRLSRKGIATYAIDVRGFGSWMQLKGNDQIDFKGCLGDIKAALVAIHQANPGIPVFILGESMGGAIALRACSQDPDLLDGLISSVPAGSRFQQKKTDLKVAVKFLEGRHKEFPEGDQVVAQASGENSVLKDDWESDRLDRMNFSAEQLLQFQEFMNGNHDVAKLIKTTPVLMLQGSLDTLVKPEGTWDLFNALPTKEKSFFEIPSEHLVLEEGRAKTRKYDARTAELIAGWIIGEIPEPTSDQTTASASTTPSSLKPVAPASAIGAATTNGVPTVLIFTAPWCEECQAANAWIPQAQTELRGGVNIKTLDVSDLANSQLSQTFGVAPIPTCVFLNRDGSVNSILIGRCQFENFEEHASALLH